MNIGRPDKPYSLWENSVGNVQNSFISYYFPVRDKNEYS